MTSRINANLSSIVLIFRYMGGVGTGTSWFDTPAQPSDSPTCNVFGARDSCCSSDWVQDNVDDDLYSLTDLISADNTGCYDAIEALRCKNLW